MLGFGLSAAQNFTQIVIFCILHNKRYTCIFTKKSTYFTVVRSKLLNSIKDFHHQDFLPLPRHYNLNSFNIIGQPQCCPLWPIPWCNVNMRHTSFPFAAESSNYICQSNNLSRVMMSNFNALGLVVFFQRGIY